MWWRSIGDRLLADARLGALLAHCYNALVDHRDTPLNQWERIEQWAQRRLEHGVTVADMAQRCGMDRSTFTKAYQDERGWSPGAFLRDRRIDRARQLLEAGHATLSSIAMMCGYRSRGAFDQAFKTATGVRPAQWRAGCRERMESTLPGKNPLAAPQRPSLLRPK